MKKILFLAALVLLTGVVVAQESQYMRVTQLDGTETDFALSTIDSISFITKTDQSCTENGHEYVDLGLSVMWATCNVGATTPEGYGDYFAWGETQPKTPYSWSSYKWCEGSSKELTKYCTSLNYGNVDNVAALDDADDAALANWGGKWRMPTKEEQEELLNNCTWVRTTKNGVAGYEVKSKTNNHSIFLPAAGYYDGSELNGSGSEGSYWSSSLFSASPSAAYCLYFVSHNLDCGSSHRYYGNSVRAVCQSR